MSATVITIEATVKSSIEKVWKSWTEPQHITQWNTAAAEWYCPKASNDLKEGGKFSFTMAARDGSMSFDFSGTYTKVKLHESIEYTLDDDRKVKVTFQNKGSEVYIVESFEAEKTNTEEMQKFGWQAILDNFKNYTESSLKN